MEEQVGGVKRGWWTKRLDIDPVGTNLYFHTFNLTEDTLWLLEKMPNVEIITIPGFCNPVYSRVQYDWLIDVQHGLGKLEQLRRVEWHGDGYDLLDFHWLTELCPNLEHVAVALARSYEISPDAVPITHDRIHTLLLQWFQSDDASPPFTGWSLPSLRHMTYYVHQGQSIPMLLPLLRMQGAHMRSLEIPIESQYDMYSRPYLDLVLPLVPNLNTIILDIFKTDFDEISNPGHANLCCVGWRLRTRFWRDDFKTLHAAVYYFDKALYPQLERMEIVHPDPLSTYTKGIAQNSREGWNYLMDGEILVFDYHGNRAVIPVEDEDEENDED